jgi:hypothetical protein
MNSIPSSPNGIRMTICERFMERFVTFCAEYLKLGYGSIKLYLSAVRAKYIEEEMGDIFLNMQRLRVTLRGIRKVHAKPKRLRIPLTAVMLHKIGAQLMGQGVVGQEEDTLLWAALCVGFFGALRCGEFTDGNLLVSDIIFMQDETSKECYVSLTLKSSKTDPFRQGCTIFLCATHQFLCPYQALLSYYNRGIRGKRSQDQPLFCHANGMVMTRSSFLHNLHCVLRVVDIPVEGMSGHSLRKGLATTAANANVQDSMISVMGRWASDCYKLYISTPRSSIAKAQQTIAKQIK